MRGGRLGMGCARVDERRPVRRQLNLTQEEFLVWNRVVEV